MKNNFHTMLFAIVLFAIYSPVNAQFSQRWTYSTTSTAGLSVGSANLDDDANMEVVIETPDENRHNGTYHVIDAITGAEEGSLGPYFYSQISFVQVNSSGKCGMLVGNQPSFSQAVIGDKKGTKLTIHINQIIPSSR